MARKALLATEVAVKGEGGDHVVLDRGEIRDLLKEGNLGGMYKYALHERSIDESAGDPVREFHVGQQGGVLLDTRPTAESVISSSEPDRDGDIMVQSGMTITDNYVRNPTVFGLHEHSIPVGFTDWLRQYDTFTWARWQWLVDVPQSEGKDYYEMWIKHVLNCTSVGFMIDDYTLINADDFWAGWVIKKWELLEHSPVSLPSNREAMRTDGLKSLFRGYAERVFSGPSPVLKRLFEEAAEKDAPLSVPVNIQLTTQQEMRKAIRDELTEVLKGRGGLDTPDEDRSGEDAGVQAADVDELKEWTPESIHLAAAAGAIDLERVCELMGKLIEEEKAVTVQKEAELASATDNIHGLEAEILDLSAQIVETFG